MQPLPLIESRTFRSCGECTACCTALAVDEIDKEEFVKCEHDCGTHCGIYQTRPNSCRGYQCLWTAMKEEVDNTFRPDNLGVILELQQSSIGPAVTVREIVPEIMRDEDGPAWRFVMAVAASVGAFIIVFQPGKQRRSIFPPWAAHLAEKARLIVQGYKGDSQPVIVREVHRLPVTLEPKDRSKRKADKDKEKRKKKLATKQRRRNR